MTKAEITAATKAGMKAVSITVEPALSTFTQAGKRIFGNAKRSASHTARDIADGFFEITHNGFAMLGLALVFAVITLTARPDLRQAGENQLISWLEERRDANVEYEEPAVIVQVHAVEPKELPKQQALLAYWLARKYGVAPEPLGVLVSHAFEIGAKAKLEPTLILAIMAIESGFNPFAQSPVGAQGLMQVMTKIHTDKYENFGGKLAAFDPVTNLRVGVKVLQECIAKAGSVEGGLKFYVGAGNLADDGGYASKVMAEYSRLQQVIGGKPHVPAPRALPVKMAPADSDVQIVENMAALAS